MAHKLTILCSIFIILSHCLVIASNSDHASHSYSDETSQVNIDLHKNSISPPGMSQSRTTTSLFGSLVPDMQWIYKSSLSFSYYLGGFHYMAPTGVNEEHILPVSTVQEDTLKNYRLKVEEALKSEESKLEEDFGVASAIGEFFQSSFNFLSAPFTFEEDSDAIDEPKGELQVESTCKDHEKSLEELKEEKLEEFDGGFIWSIMASMAEAFSPIEEDIETNSLSFHYKDTSSDFESQEPGIISFIFGSIYDFFMSPFLDTQSTTSESIQKEWVESNQDMPQAETPVSEESMETESNEATTHKQFSENDDTTYKPGPQIISESVESESIKPKTNFFSADRILDLLSSPFVSIEDESRFKSEGGVFKETPYYGKFNRNLNSDDYEEKNAAEDVQSDRNTETHEEERKHSREEEKVQTEKEDTSSINIDIKDATIESQDLDENYFMFDGVFDFLGSPFVDTEPEIAELITKSEQSSHEILEAETLVTHESKEEEIKPVTTESQHETNYFHTENIYDKLGSTFASSDNTAESLPIAGDQAKDETYYGKFNRKVDDYDELQLRKDTQSEHADKESTSITETSDHTQTTPIEGGNDGTETSKQHPTSASTSGEKLVDDTSASASDEKPVSGVIVETESQFTLRKFIGGLFVAKNERQRSMQSICMLFTWTLVVAYISKKLPPKKLLMKQNKPVTLSKDSQAHTDKKEKAPIEKEIRDLKYSILLYKQDIKTLERQSELLKQFIIVSGKDNVKYKDRLNKAYQKLKEGRMSTRPAAARL